MILGLLLTLKRRLTQSRQETESTPAGRFYCYSCGYTNEHVQNCQFEDGQILVRKPLCFACAVARDAVVLNDPH
jgi:hypothetical protein